MISYTEFSLPPPWTEDKTYKYYLGIGNTNTCPSDFFSSTQYTLFFFFHHAAL